MDAVSVPVNTSLTPPLPPYVALIEVNRQAPRSSPATGAYATSTSTPESAPTVHVTSAAAAPAPASSKSQSLSYAAMTRVCPSAVTVTVAAASLALNAGKFVTYTAASSATVTLEDVPSHWGVHGQNPAE